MFKKLTSILAVLVLVFVSTTTASAMADRDDIQAQRDAMLSQRQAMQEENAARRQERQDLREAFADEKCQEIQTRLSTRTQDFESKRTAHLKAYENLKTRIQSVIDRLAARGADTATLAVGLSTLNSMIVQYGSDYAAFIDSLAAAHTLACGHAEGDFRQGLADSRLQLQSLRQERVEIRLFYADTIRPAIEALRTQMQELRPVSSTVTD